MKRRQPAATPDPALLDAREWRRWASEPDRGQGLRFFLSTQWPFPVVQWQLRPGRISPRNHTRFFALMSDEGQDLRDAIALAGSLFVNRNAARNDRTAGRRLAREGLRHLSAARDFAGRGEVQSALRLVRLAEYSFVRLRALILEPYARRALAREHASKLKNAQGGEETRARVEAQAKRLTAGGSKPRELASLIAKALRMDPGAIRAHLRALGYLPPVRPRAKK